MEGDTVRVFGVDHNDAIGKEIGLKYQGEGAGVLVVKSHEWRGFAIAVKLHDGGVCIASIIGENNLKWNNLSYNDASQSSALTTLDKDRR